MVLAFVISVCASGDALFIRPLTGTFMPGSIATFLMFGPIIDIKMLAVMRPTLMTRSPAKPVMANQSLTQVRKQRIQISPAAEFTATTSFAGWRYPMVILSTCTGP